MRKLFFRDAEPQRKDSGMLDLTTARKGFLLAAALFALASCLSGSGVAAEPEETPKVLDLGPPLVDDINDLKKLHAVLPVWIDLKHKQVVLMGQTCRANYPLEFLATYPPRGYESILMVQVKPSLVHAGLLALGAEPGHPARFEPKFEPATGTEVEIEVRWKDKAGKPQRAPAREWVRDVKTKQALTLNWVFSGSRFWTDEATGKQVYRADGAGDFISVLNLPTATLDLPIRSASALESRLYEGFVEHMPPEKTPVTMILKPKLAEKTRKPS
jgi:hypothetical protein